MEQSIFLHVPQVAIDQILERKPVHLRAFASLLSVKLGIDLLHPDRIALLPPKARVAWRLLMLAEGYGHLSHARRLITLDEIQSVRTTSLARAELLDVLQDLHQRKIVRLGDEQLEVFDVFKLHKAASVKRAKSLC